MTEGKKNSTDTNSGETTPETNFDRQAYLKEVRSTLLKNMGLPENTKPDQVMHLLAIQEKLKEHKEK